MAKAALPGFDERFASIRGRRVRYFVAGSGPPLVLVHGLGGGASNWVELAPRLACRRRVLVPDLPGHSGSDPLAATPNLAPFADVLALLAAREDMTPAAYVGHSFGGLVALRLALRHPAAVSALVLMASAGVSSTSRRARYLLETVAIIKPARRLSPFRNWIGQSKPLLHLAFGYWGADDPSSLSPEMVDGLLAPPGLHMDASSAARAIWPEDLRPELAAIMCPCLVLWGARDHQLPVADGFELARRLGAPLRVIPACGHIPIGERPDVCIEAIEQFLDGIGKLDELPLQPEALG
jgi:pimeloyl-ACP methyl ester carboxylesterase